MSHIKDAINEAFKDPEKTVWQQLISNKTVVRVVAFATVILVAVWAFLTAPTILGWVNTSGSSGWQTADVLKYVDPLVATYGPGKLESFAKLRGKLNDVGVGHAFAGASLPYAMVKAVADTTENNRGGFSSDGDKVTGFSHMHDTGTGGVGNILQKVHLSILINVRGHQWAIFHYSLCHHVKTTSQMDVLPSISDSEHYTGRTIP
jgi:hypothetical protein